MNTIAILYTHNLSGQLELLPQLYTFIRELKTPYSSGEFGKTVVILLDLGNTCSPDAWHCDATDNRSMLVGLDGMGYQAVNVQETLSVESRAKLEEQVTLMLVDDNHPHMYIGKIAFETQDGRFFQPSTPDLAINLTTQEETTLKDNRLSLIGLEGMQVGVAVLTGSPYELTHTSVHDLPKNTNPDPTIAGVVEFIISEARYYQNRKSD